MLGDFASLDVQNTYRGSDAYVNQQNLEACNMLGLNKKCVNLLVM
ncbi:hypothetical protein [Piscirickettsia salmonis]|nr:hypothetical protein [Piscirickettsia salmonis]